MLSAILSLLVYSSDARSGVRMGIDMCLHILIPSLFPFMFVSVFLTRSGFGDNLGAIFDFLTRKLFKLPSCCSVAIFLSSIGGYPAGASAVKTLFDEDKINEKQAKRLAYFCVSCGPAYAINVVGMSIFRSFRLGLILFAGQFLALISLALLLNIGVKYAPFEKQYIQENIRRDLSSDFVNSCKISTIAMANICSFVILFSALIFILDACGISELFADFLSKLYVPQKISASILAAILEVTNATSKAAALKMSPIFFSFLLAFGGMSVHFQIFSILGNINVSKVRFFFIRLVQAFLAVFFTYILLKIFHCPLVSNMNLYKEGVETTKSGAWGSLSLVFMSCIFLLSVKSNSKKYSFKLLSNLGW